MSETVIPLFCQRVVPPDPHARFCAVRREMLLAFRAWVEAGAHPADTQMELDGVRDVLRQLRDVFGRDGG